MIAGSVTHSEQRSLSGIPGLGQVPALNRVTATNSKQEMDDELLVVITPHIVSTPETNSAVVWLGR